MRAYPAIFTPEAEGGYSVWFPDCLGCVTQGDTLAEAKAMAGDALSGWLDVTRDCGDPIPPRSRMTDVRRAARPRAIVALIGPIARPGLFRRWAIIDAERTTPKAA